MQKVIRTISIAAVLLILAGVNVHAGYTPDEGELQLLTNALKATGAMETVYLKLLRTRLMPANATVASDLTEISSSYCPGYAAVSLTASSWTVATSSNKAQASYAKQTFTFTGPFTAVVSGRSMTCTNGSTTITTTNTASLVVGDRVTGTGIPTNAYITTITANTSITISAAFTGTTGSVSLTFYPSVWGAYLIGATSGKVYRIDMYASGPWYAESSGDYFEATPLITLQDSGT